MLATDLLTHLPIFNFRTNSNSKSKPNSNSFCHRCSSRSLNLSREFLSGKSRRGLMGERVVRILALGSNDGDESSNNIGIFEQESLIDGSDSQFTSALINSGFESVLNRLSKWLVAAIFGAVILWRHDPEAVWVVMGSVLNSALSVFLKRVLNHERPASIRRSDPGMPSSHAQSIFFAVVFVTFSMVEWQGVNEFTLMFAAVSLAAGSYFSWLRVAQQYHTVSQVVVGAIIGSFFSLLWLWSWDVFVSDAFISLFLVRLAILVTSAICCLGFLTYVVLNWFSDDR